MVICSYSVQMQNHSLCLLSVTHSLTTTAIDLETSSHVSTTRHSIYRVAEKKKDASRKASQTHENRISLACGAACNCPMRNQAGLRPLHINVFPSTHLPSPVQQPGLCAAVEKQSPNGPERTTRKLASSPPSSPDRSPKTTHGPMVLTPPPSWSHTTSDLSTHDTATPAHLLWRECAPLALQEPHSVTAAATFPVGPASWAATQSSRFVVTLLVGVGRHSCEGHWISHTPAVPSAVMPCLWAMKIFFAVVSGERGKPNSAA
ncbi:uncharacterized protein B0H64DRAFT_402343 [Chaetomium fimeti]|uniref:Uncharacterized protein n=1 Tax=Chaetomium fimeti TaxID=1854472 RepID=A0AAE0HEC1_9PEZI|nr:hypothetical protein B0H64DRAFT_402343 [Chaetomium fimeti]